MSMSPGDSDESQLFPDQDWTDKTRHSKRRKLGDNNGETITTASHGSTDTFMELKLHGPSSGRDFEPGLLPERLRGRAGSSGRHTTPSEDRRRAQVKSPNLTPIVNSATPLTAIPTVAPASSVVLDALNSVVTTPFSSSFLSRLHISKPQTRNSALAVDWESTTPWTSLLEDIHAHHVLSHPHLEPIPFTPAPITYSSLQPVHLRQVHELLSRTFWNGIDVSDSLDYSPELCTLVATYKFLVVGVAIMSSPQETYITYLAVRSGWENAHIARNMLYHLITLNPNKDITLHVSVNNSAMLLYNRFGFKAEEFVAGFYEAYFDHQSRQSKNAFKLRLRQL